MEIKIIKIYVHYIYEIAWQKKEGWQMGVALISQGSFNKTQN